MKKYLILSLLLITGIPSFSGVSDHWKESRHVIFAPQKGSEYHALSPGESLKAVVKLDQSGCSTRKFLRVVGKVDMPAPFSSRGESNFRLSEFYIDDNLDSSIVAKEKYSLYFKGNNNNFERHAYYRIPGDRFRPGKVKAVLPVVRQHGLKTGADGDFGMELELYYKKEGRNVNDVYDRPDSVIYVAVPSGNFKKYRQIEHSFEIPDNLACILVRVGGPFFEGECGLESPRFYQNGKSVCRIPFCKYAQRDNDMNYWVGINLSTRSWPLWKLNVNGTPVFKDNIFDRGSNVADFYIPLPESVSDGDTIELQLLREDHRAAYSYSVRSLEMIEESMRDFEIIAVPKYVATGERFGILVETNRRGVELNVQCDDDAEVPFRKVSFDRPGLHVIDLRAGNPGGRFNLSFSDGTHRVDTFVTQVIDKQPDHVYLSSGDEIYIDKQYVSYNYFFKWYISQRVGNWYQFRPSYQWSGFRVADDTIIRHYVTLLDRLRMPYAWQVEGRTLAGSRINPSLDVLDTDMFMGKQAHENDGGYYYWQHFKYTGLLCDMAARTRPYGGIFAKHRPIFTDHGNFIHYDTQGVTDMADGARKFVDNLRYSKGESTRHTGPSSLFRYFYQAGYEWLGAEQMYGPEETILSSLRGASRAYSRPVYGTLHAMQWGSFPFTDPKHALRHYMSLAVAYMHGSSHLNTEEALWLDEYVNDRYSESGKAHMYSQHQMLDYIETHTRRGELLSNIAVIQGRNDAWKSFGRGPLWSQESEKWKFNKACESFDLLRVFYPDNRIDISGPDGWFTATPYGTVDLLPVEAPLDVLNKYKALIFLGWNTYDESDFVHIRDYVFNGGTILLSAAHLNAELQPDAPATFPENDALIRELLGENYRSLQGKNELAYGKGKIIYFASPRYPADAAILPEYEKTMHQLAGQSLEGEHAKGWIKQSDHVGFTVWDQGERRTLLLLNTDWQSEQPEHAAKLALGDKVFELPARRYHIETVHCSHGLAVYGMSNTTDVLSIEKTSEGWTVKVQTTGKDTVKILNSVSGAETCGQIDGAGIHVLKIMSVTECLPI